jgi:hypothetical protein
MKLPQTVLMCIAYETEKKPMTCSHPMRHRVLLTLAALGLAAALGGCVAYPAYPAYGYGYGSDYGGYPGGYVSVGGGWGWHGGDGDGGGWHGGDGDGH